MKTFSEGEINTDIFYRSREELLYELVNYWFCNFLRGSNAHRRHHRFKKDQRL